MDKTQIQATLRLFKSYVLPKNKDVKCIDKYTGLIKGIIFTEDITEDIYNESVEMYGKKPEEWNATFHKSFSTVLDAPIEQLVAQQLIHYFTTYGLESLDIYNSDLVYIPAEDLEIPELTESVPLAVIHSITEDQLKDKLLTLLISGIALSKQTINDVMTLSDYINQDNFDDIQNREVKIALYEKYGVVPSNNVEFLRYVIYKLTGSTLLIKNKKMFESLKCAYTTEVLNYLKAYVNKPNGYIELAKIFNRFKPLFLAFKRERGKEENENINAIINKINNLSKKYHEPLKTNILDDLTTFDNLQQVNMFKDKILKELDKVTTFRETRILNALKYRTTDCESMVYVIRNGLAYVKPRKEKDLKYDKKLVMKELYNLVYEHFIQRLSVLKNKSIYVPKNINYTVPTTEKQFLGNIPQGSYITLDRSKNLIVGIHWKNLQNHRVDLDLHALNRNTQFGWNSFYRSSDSGIAFSGDITDAQLPNGATEVFLIKPNCNVGSLLLYVNDFLNLHTHIPFELIIAYMESDEEIYKKYTIDPNKAICYLSNSFEPDTTEKAGKSEVTLGYVDIKQSEIVYYFNNLELTRNSAVCKNSTITQRVFDYLKTYSTTQLDLLQVLTDCEANLTDSPVVEELVPVNVKTDEGEVLTLYKKVTKPCDYDLSLNTITKDTLIKLMTEV